MNKYDFSKSNSKKLLKRESVQNLELNSPSQGHVYVISNLGSFGEGVYKIGLTGRLEPLDRVRELGDASVPFLFDEIDILRRCPFS